MPSLTGPLFTPFDPATLLMMMGANSQDPTLQNNIASHLAAIGKKPPATDPTQHDPGTRPPQGTLIAPGGQTTASTPTVRPPGEAMASSALASGETDRKPPNTTGIRGSDGQSIQPPDAMTYSASQRSTSDTRGQPSPKDQTAHAGEETNTSQTGDVGTDADIAQMVADVTPQGTQVAPFTSADTTMGKIGTGLTTAFKGMGALAPPQNQDIRMANAPLPAHESRFTPQDLLQMISILGQSGSKTQPSSLGALIGR